MSARGFFRPTSSKAVTSLVKTSLPISRTDQTQSAPFEKSVIPSKNSKRECLLLRVEMSSVGREHLQHLLFRQYFSKKPTAAGFTAARTCDGPAPSSPTLSPTPSRPTKSVATETPQQAPLSLPTRAFPLQPLTSRSRTLLAMMRSSRLMSFDPVRSRPRELVCPRVITGYPAVALLLHK